ncbi:MAG: NADH-quinone oxidoreductase subunit M [Actinomycetia bacterium]|nr:NADH-quinone oxidoreductase subunit M [Actinomycetes bacterium]
MSMLLTILGALPLLGAVVTFAVRGHLGRWIGLVFAAATLALGVTLVAMQGHGYDFTVQYSWIPAIGAWWALSLTGLAKPMVLLATILPLAVLIVTWRLGEDDDDAIAPDEVAADPVEREARASWRGGLFTPLALLVQGLALFVFLSNDLLLFFFFFEATLVPAYFLIGGWGGVRRGGAALKFLLYSLGGGLVMLAGVVQLIANSVSTGTPSLLLGDLAHLPMSAGVARWCFIAFFVAFAVKAPMVPVHSWLPDVAGQAAPGATVLVVGVLDKIGAFGMIALCLRLFPQASQWAAPVVLILALISILYGALMAAVSRSLMRLVAFTSISHFGFMVFGIFSFTSASITGAAAYMFAHGLSAAALLLVAGWTATKLGTQSVGEFTGVARKAPLLAGLFLMSGLATLSLPGFANFAGEFLALAGAWQRHPVYTAVATLGTLLAAVYVMLAYQRTMTGEPDEATAEQLKADLGIRQAGVAGVLVALLLVGGFVPSIITTMVAPTTQQTMTALGVDDPSPAILKGK